MGYVIELAASRGYVLFRPTRPSESMAELIRRWSRVAELGRKHDLTKVLVDHREIPPARNVDMIAAALQFPGWREDENWRIAILCSQRLAHDSQLTLHTTAEFLEAIHHKAEIFWELDAAERWLANSDAGPG